MPPGSLISDELLVGCQKLFIIFKGTKVLSVIRWLASLVICPHWACDYSCRSSEQQEKQISVTTVALTWAKTQPAFPIQGRNWFLANVVGVVIIEKFSISSFFSCLPFYSALRGNKTSLIRSFIQHTSPDTSYVPGSYLTHSWLGMISFRSIKKRCNLGSHGCFQ